MSKRAIWYLAGAVVVVAVIAGVVWFEPHKLFIDDKVNEAAPAGAVLTQGAPANPAGPVVLASGSFVTHEHSTMGTAQFIRLPDGSRTLRFEDLNTSNGPDLRVYLSSKAPDAGWHAFGDDYVELGKLKGNVGSQNYDIPANVDLARYGTAVIWCKRFSVSFGAAAVRPV